MNRHFRLTGSADFKRVRHNGKSFPHPFVVLVIAPNDVGKARIAVAAGRSVGNAVQRNRAKRVMRAAIRPMLKDIHPGWDLLLIARRPIMNVSSQETQFAVADLLRRANVLPRTHAG